MGCCCNLQISYGYLLATLIKIDLNKFERINSRKGKELLRKNSVALYLPHVSPILTSPEPSIAQPIQ